MNRTTVFSKTGKGLLEIKNKSNRLSKDQFRVLNLVDGKATLDDLVDKSRITEVELRKVLAALADGGFIKEFTNPTATGDYTSVTIPPVPPSTSYVDDLDFTQILGPAKSAKPGFYQSAQTEQKQREESARKASEAAASKAREEAEKRGKEEAARRAQEEESARRIREAAERKAKEEQTRREKLEAEMRYRLEEPKRLKEEAERKAREKLEAEKRIREEAERKVREEAERRAKIQAEAAARVEAERKRREEEEQAELNTVAESLHSFFPLRNGSSRIALSAD
jgi:chemotaxis protein histidine kinase CheA